MIVVEASHVHVMEFLPLYIQTLMWRDCQQCQLCELIHILLIFFIWSGNPKFYIQFLRQLGLQSFVMTLHKENVVFS
jgi:hypothetical protein